MNLYSKYDLIYLPIAFVVMLIITTASYFLLRRRGENIKRIPFIIIAALMLSLEVYKQIENFKLESLNLYWLPLHYCSLFFLFIPLAEFTRGRFREYFKAVSFSAALTVSIFFYIAPQCILGRSTELMIGEFYHFHSFLFHNLIILYVMLSIALGSYRYRRGDFLRVFLLFFGYCIIAIPMSHILNTNYCNFLFTIIKPLEYVRVNCGQFIYSLIFLFGIPLGTATVGYGYEKIRSSLNERLK